VNQIKWWDVLFKTQRYMDFCNHVTILESSIPQLAQFELVQNSLNNTQSKLQESNRELTRVNSELRGLRVEMGKLQTAYDLSVREANSLGEQLARVVQPAKPKATASSGNRGASSSKTERYAQQYHQGGQVHSTPDDNTALHMQAASPEPVKSSHSHHDSCDSGRSSWGGDSGGDSGGGGGGGCD